MVQGVVGGWVVFTKLEIAVSVVDNWLCRDWVATNMPDEPRRYNETRDEIYVFSCLYNKFCSIVRIGEIYFFWSAE